MLSEVKALLASEDLVVKSIQKIRDRSGKFKGSAFMLSSTALAACGGGGTVLPPPPPPPPTNGFTLANGNEYTGTDQAESLDQSAATVAIVVDGLGGNDTITSGSGADTIDGGAGNDTITSNGGADTIVGGSGNDTINAGDGNDMIRGGIGADTINGGDGNDIIVVVGTTSADQYSDSSITNPAGSGTDLSSLIALANLNNQSTSEAVSGEVIDGGAGTNTLYVYGTVDFTDVTLTNVTQVVVNSDVTFSDDQLGAGGITKITGDGGSTIRIEASDNAGVTVDLSTLDLTNVNRIDVGANVTVTVGSGTDLKNSGISVVSGEGALQLTSPGAASDMAGIALEDAMTVKDDAGATVEHTDTGAIVVTSDQANNAEPSNIVVLTDGNDLFYGTKANDIIDAKEGIDTVYGGAGNDYIVGTGNGSKTFDGGDGDDTLVVTSDAGWVNLGGGDGNDTLTGGDNGGSLTGGFGDDILNGGAGGDSLYGGFGNDTLNAGDGNDTIRLSSGDDVITLGAGADNIIYYGQPQGHHVINDYNPDEDRVIDLRRAADLSAGNSDGVITVADLDITDTANGALLTISEDHSILFKGLTKAELAIDDNFLLPGVVGGDGDDTLSTNTDSRYNAFVVGGEGNDTITGASVLSHSYSRLQGGAGDDTITGADDPIYQLSPDYSTHGVNYINGGPGNDTLTGGGNDSNYNGTGGGDTLRYLYDPAGVTVNLLTGTATDGWGDTDTISGFEDISLTPFDDIITTGGGPFFEVTSGEGADTVIQGDTGFVDVRFSDTGNHFTGFDGALSLIRLYSYGGDTVDSTAGVATVQFSTVQNPNYIYDSIPEYTIDLSVGTAKFNAGEYSPHTLIDVENVIGTYGDDTIIGNDLDNILSGGVTSLMGNHVGSPSNFNPAEQHVHFVGTDTFTGGGGADTFIIHVSVDFIAYDLANASVITDFEDGVDKLVLGGDAGILGLGDPIIEQGTGEYANDTIIKYLLPDGIGLDPSTGIQDQYFIDNQGPHYTYAVILKDTDASTITADDFVDEPSFYPVTIQGASGNITQVDLDMAVDVSGVSTSEQTSNDFVEEEMFFNALGDDGTFNYDYF